jgi:hypothetical protein
MWPCKLALRKARARAPQVPHELIKDNNLQGSMPGERIALVRESLIETNTTISKIRTKLSNLDA